MLDSIGLAGDYEPDTAFLEDTADLVGEVTTDLFAAHQASQPPALSLRIARQVAAAEVADAQVRVYPGSSDERFGVIVEDFGNSAGYAVTIGHTRIAEPSRRWAINLDDGTLIFVDTTDLQSLRDKI